jgi:AraC family transcriptional regulator, arabinose operon regulatory protein
MDIHIILQYYLKANIQIEGIYRMCLEPGSIALRQTTTDQVYGLLFPIRGKAAFRVNGKKYILEPGKILHAGPSMTLDKKVIGTEQWEYFLVHYRSTDIQNSTEQELKEQTFFYEISEVHRMELFEILSQLMMYQRNQNLVSKLRMKSLFLRFLGDLLDAAKEWEMGCLDEPVEQILTYIHEHLGEPLTILGLAEHFSMDSKQLYYLFQKKEGICPKRFIIETRIQKAKELLLQETMNISEISYRVGYDDPLMFSRIFKKHTGESPSAFRNRFGKNP